jgi:hypothetical protein
MELKKRVNVEITDYIVFFKGLKSMKLTLVLMMFKVSNFQAQLNNTWFDFMFVLTFAKNDTCG